MSEIHIFWKVLTVILILGGVGSFFYWAINDEYDTGYNEGYFKGQVDAINGKVKYELKVNEDGETVYEEVTKQLPSIP